MYLKQYIATLILCGLGFASTAQSNVNDTIPFHLEKTLIVFKGTINGVEADFAFDTGAAISVSNDALNSQCKIAETGGKRSIIDANQKVAKIENRKIDDIAVGRFHIRNLKIISTEMPFLACSNLLLLGQDFIKKFNWKFDFENKRFFISSSVFSSTSTMQAWPLQYKSNRPIIDYEVNGIKYKNCLIDMGFGAVMDISSKNNSIVKIADAKKTLGQANQYFLSNMGLMGMGKSKENDEIILDSISFAGTKIKQFKVLITDETDTKIGVSFFVSYFKTAILNFREDKLYVEMRDQAVEIPNRFDVKVSLDAGKLVITSINTSPNSTAKNLSIREEIKTVNGKSIKDFSSDCDVWNFLLFYNEPTRILEKMNGEKITVGRSSVF